MAILTIEISDDAIDLIDSLLDQEWNNLREGVFEEDLVESYHVAKIQDEFLKATNKARVDEMCKEEVNPFKLV